MNNRNDGDSFYGSQNTQISTNDGYFNSTLSGGSGYYESINSSANTFEHSTKPEPEVKSQIKSRYQQNLPKTFGQSYTLTDSIYSQHRFSEKVMSNPYFADKSKEKEMLDDNVTNLTSQRYKDLCQQVEEGRPLTNQQRLLFCHDFLTRYHNRILTSEENRTFVHNHQIGHGMSVGLSIVIPINVGLMMQMRYNAQRYTERCKRATIFSGLLCCIWVAYINKENEFMDRLSGKYFKGLTDDELVKFDITQYVPSIDREEMKAVESSSSTTSSLTSSLSQYSSTNVVSSSATSEQREIWNSFYANSIPTEWRSTVVNEKQAV